MSWSEVPFDAIIADSAFGPRFSGDCYADDGNVATLRTTDLSPDGSISLDTMPHARIDEDKFEGHFLKVGDLVISRSGRIGTTALFDGYHKPVLPGAFLIRFRLDLSRAYPLFFRLFFNSNEGQQRLLSVAQGAAQQNINITNVRKLSVPLPPLSEQRRIARLLASYDDLIATNQRRIALLEDAARRLYREWFVHLRFPGREALPVVDGVPQGWSRRELADCCELVDYGYTASASQDAIGPRFLRITDIVPNTIDWSSVPYCAVEGNRLGRFRLTEGDIVIARTGATVGYAKRLNKHHPEAVFASYLVRLRPKADVDNIMLGIFVESDEYKKFVRSRVGGAAQPNASARVLASAEILVPDMALQNDFHAVAEPLIDQRESLQEQNEKLRRARDLLLPKLMSGQLDVSGITLPQAAHTEGVPLPC